MISSDVLPDHRVKIAYIFDGESRESVVENRKGLLPFLANLLGLDADDSIDNNTLKMLMYTDPIIFPLDEEGLPEPSIHKLVSLCSQLMIRIETGMNSSGNHYLWSCPN